MKRSLSRRDALKALTVAAPIAAASPALAQSSADEEAAAAERQLTAMIEEIRRYPLPPGAEPAAIFKA